MRDIKFRGKRLDNGEWIYGDLLRYMNYTWIQYAEMKNPYGSGIPERKPIPRTKKFTVNPDTVGQYTGLKDNNGIEVYEGDIVKVFDILDDPRIDVVTMSQFPLFWLEHEEFGWEGEELVSHDDFVILGNNWDNPDLLEG